MAESRNVDDTGWQRASLGGFGESVERDRMVADVYVHAIGYGRSSRHRRSVCHGQRLVQFHVWMLFRVLLCGEHALAVERRRYGVAGFDGGGFRRPGIE